MSVETKTEWAGAEFDGVRLRVWIDGQMSVRTVSGKAELVLQSILADRQAEARAVLRSGWPDAPLNSVPSAVASTPFDGLLPGLSQNSPADLMRYQTGRIRGFLAGFPEFDGVLCLVGQSTVWAHISAGEVVSFRSFLTAELFSIIQSFDALPVTDTLNSDAFTAALNHAISRPGAIAADLAGIRAQLALGQADRDAVASRLAGLLIGIELAAAKPYWLGQDIVVVGNGPWAGHYLAALTAQGLTAKQADGEAMAHAGLIAAWQAMQGKTG
ncbi:2-dehydro-3-deoxygalactonokinase [Paracoccus amoyensis]|nr:2-dehydro-3-deoxygalactonokinase [Paracoccus amoyensis]